jgi:hypothetical protein
MPVVPATQEEEVGGMWSETSSSKSLRPYQKYKMGWSMVQVAKCLLSKCKALSSIPSTTKKNKFIEIKI